MDTRAVAYELRRQHWAGILRERTASGQTVREYCREHGIKEKTYYYWQRKLREAVCEQLVEEQERSFVPQATFAEVKAAPARAGTITIRRGDCEIEIAGEASPAAIEAVLRILSER